MHFGYICYRGSSLQKHFPGYLFDGSMLDQYRVVRSMTTGELTSDRNEDDSVAKAINEGGDENP